MIASEHQARLSSGMGSGLEAKYRSSHGPGLDVGETRGSVAAGGTRGYRMVTGEMVVFGGLLLVDLSLDQPLERSIFVCMCACVSGLEATGGRREPGISN